MLMECKLFYIFIKIILMKKWFLIIITISPIFLFSQSYETQKNITIDSKNLIEVEIYHDNGNIYQKGFLKNNKLHGVLQSYDIDGDLVVLGEFNKGKKNGKWIFWNNDQVIVVNYKNNKILNYLETQKDLEPIVVR